jgi:hypothetical protein
LTPKPDPSFSGFRPNSGTFSRYSRLLRASIRAHFPDQNPPVTPKSEMDPARNETLIGPLSTSLAGRRSATE